VGVEVGRKPGYDAPVLFLAFMHSSAWKGNSQKFICRILHISPSESREDGL
jgi:hypothetical protein